MILVVKSEDPERDPGELDLPGSVPARRLKQKSPLDRWEPGHGLKLNVCTGSEVDPVGT